MMKKILPLSIVLISVVAWVAWAGTLSFSKKIQTGKLSAELTTATGLFFEEKIDCSTCTQTGWIEYSATGSNYSLVVGIWETLEPSNPKQSSATWTTDLQNTITATVNAHTP